MRRWLKLDQRFPFGQTTTRIQEQFGSPGLAVWVCLLAEAKRQVPEGHVEFVNDHHFWGLLGLTKNVPEFTVDEFLTFTGQLKQTRRTRSGRVSDVVLTRWGDWQDDWRREGERERKSRKRHESEADTLRTRNGQPADKKRTEIEIEREIDLKPLPGKPARKRDELWDTLTHELGSTPSTQSERGRWNAALKQLRDAGATPAELRSRCKVYRKRWPEISLTPTALAANWGSLDSLSEMDSADRWKRHFEAKS